VLVRLRRYPEHDHVRVALPSLGVDSVRARGAEEHERLAADLIDGVATRPVLDLDVGHAQGQFVHVLHPREAPPCLHDRSVGTSWKGNNGRMNSWFVSSLLVVLFILIGGYFSASEIALISLREGQLRRLAEEGKRGRTVAHLREDPSRFLSAVQIGVTFAGFFAASYSGATLALGLQRVLAGWGVPEGLAGTTALILITLVVSYVSLVLGELVPKRLALQRPEAIAGFVAPMLGWIAKLSRPVIWLLSVSTNAVCCRCPPTLWSVCLASTRMPRPTRSARRSCGTWSAATRS
jgi:hypothetical protein